MRIRNIIASFVGALALTVSLVACGGTPAGPNLEELAGEFVGTWEMSHAEFEEGPVAEEDYDALADLGLHVTLDLSESGDILFDAFGSQFEGTWEIKDESTITATLDGESVDMPVEDDELVLDYMGETMYFEKVSDEPNMDRDPSENAGGATVDEDLSENLDDLEEVEGTGSGEVESIGDLLDEEQILNQQLYAASVDAYDLGVRVLQRPQQGPVPADHDHRVGRLRGVDARGRGGGCRLRAAGAARMCRTA